MKKGDRKERKKKTFIGKRCGDTEREKKSKNTFSIFTSKEEWKQKEGQKDNTFCSPKVWATKYSFEI